MIMTMIIIILRIMIFRNNINNCDTSDGNYDNGIDNYDGDDNIW